MKVGDIILTFSTSFAALDWENYCEKMAIGGRMIPLPPAISGSCGLCWKCTREDIKTNPIPSDRVEKVYELQHTSPEIWRRCDEKLVSIADSGD